MFWLRLAIVLALSTTAVCVLPLSQKNALIGLYNATGGSYWSSSSFWLSAPDPCTWEGVQCDGTSANVIGINLPLNNLTGTLPDLQLPGLITM